MPQKERQPRVDIALIVAGIALPVATYVGALIWMVILAAKDPIPNQGAMVSALLALGASIFIACALVIAGVTLLIRTRSQGDSIKHF